MRLGWMNNRWNFKNQTINNMGQDAVIYIRTTHGKEPALTTPFGLTIDPKKDDDCDAPQRSTHEVDCDCMRYYSPTYERGSWPQLACILMKLLGADDIEYVWYGSDSKSPVQFTGEDLLSYTRHYLKLQESHT